METIENGKERIMHISFDLLLLLSTPSMIFPFSMFLKNASCKTHLGHFFVLNQIVKNINTETFVELICILATNTTQPDQNENENEN